MNSRYSPYLAGTLVLALSLVGTLLIENNHARESIQEKRSQTLTYLSAVRARLEGSFNATIYLNRALSVLITAQQGISRDKFDLIAREILASSQHIRTVAVAEGYVITLIYPLDENRKALGLDYSRTPQQWPAVKRAIESRETVVAGPVRLVQGGRGLINRTPIFKSSFSDRSDSGDYWGIASIVINMESVFEEAGLGGPSSGYRVAIRGQDGLGSQGKVFWGDAALFDNSPERLEVTFPNGSWELAAVPDGGWNRLGSEDLWILGSGSIIALLLGALTTISYRNTLKMKHYALHDPLTRLPNRLLFSERVGQALAHAQRNSTQLAIAVLDLNKFKPVNDRHGHLAGDFVLQQVAQRIRITLRQEDVVARAGGDEFTLLLMDIDSRNDIAIVAKKLADQLLQPFHWQGQQLRVGVSIGFAIFPTHGEDLTTLFQQADTAMYQAKQNPDTHWTIASGFHPVTNRPIHTPAREES
ncbi:MAG: sensor domain-containing diguanylate cyclase [Sedimenticola sp.]|nr:sensor domain-containing diguanylate cyclase [Sedimenticola sp.]